MKTTFTRAGQMALIETKTFADEIKKRAKKLKEKSLYEIGMVVMSDAKQLCAVNYGYLAASIQNASNDKITDLDSPSEFADKVPMHEYEVETLKPIQQPRSDDEVLVGSALDYAPYVEYGTKRMNAQPYLRPALNMAYGQVPIIWTRNGKQEFLKDLL